MKRLLIFMLIIGCLLFVEHPAVFALTTVSAPQGGGVVTIESNQTYDDNVAVAGSNVVVKGTINDSLFVAGSNVRIEGTIKENLVVAGSNVTIAGKVGKDVIAAGSTISVEKSAVIGRDLASAGTSVTMDGTVNRDIKNASSSLLVNGTVKRNIDTTSATIQLGTTAAVAGDLIYHSNKEMNIPNSDKVKGNILFQQTQEAPKKAGPNPLWWILGILQALILGTLLALLVPGWLMTTNGAMGLHPLQSFGLGLLLLIAVPIIAFILAITILGIPIAILLMVLYVFAILVSEFVTGFYLGTYIGRNRNWSPLVAMLVGVLILEIIFLIPIISFFARLIVASIGIGAIFFANPLRSARRPEPDNYPGRPETETPPEQKETAGLGPEGYSERAGMVSVPKMVNPQNPPEGPGAAPPL